MFYLEVSYLFVVSLPALHSQTAFVASAVLPTTTSKTEVAIFDLKVPLETSNFEHFLGDHAPRPPKLLHIHTRSNHSPPLPPSPPHTSFRCLQPLLISDNTFDCYLCCHADVDECESPDLNNCHADAQCTNSKGNFTCTCNPGYTGDGINCTSKI